MQKIKLTKKVRKQLDNLAKKLPTHHYWAYEYRTVAGDKILEENPDAKLEDGTPIKRGVNYSMRAPVKRERNHKRRLITVFKKDGARGVEQYIQPYIKKESPTAATEGDR